MKTLHTIAGELLDGEDADQVRAVFGNIEVDELVANLQDCVRRQAGARVRGCAYDHVSVGVTLELRLEDGRGCVLKAARAQGDGSHLSTTLAVQNRLAAAGFPAPRVLGRPQRLGRAQMHLMEVLDRGDRVTYDVSIREEMARQYARLVTLAEALQPRPTFADRSLPAGRLWPTPHSVIFDFEATQETAGPIDAIAAAARAELDEDNGGCRLAHTDWSLQNVAFRGGALVGVFDWDSLAELPETLAVAGAAAFHQQDWRYGPDRCAHDFYQGPELTLGFVEIYADERHRLGARPALDPAAVRAALLYRLGYQARCGHALDPTGPNPAQVRLEQFAHVFGNA